MDSIALSPGGLTTAYVKVSDQTSAKYYAIKITRAAAPTVNSVTVAPATATVVQGGSKQLTATVDALGGAAETVTWESDDESGKVTVDDSGLVTVAADAEARTYTITATSTEDAAKSNSAVITVTSAAIVDETAPTATLLTIEAGTRTKLIVTFDEALNSETLNINSAASLLSAATADANAGAAMVLPNNAGSVTWNTSNPDAPIATISITPTAFTIGSIARINFTADAVKDIQGNAIGQATNVDAPVVADTTAPKAIITAPVRGANVQLEVTFDEGLSSTSITNIASLLSAITYDIDGANTSISVESVNSSVTWDKTNLYAPKAIIKIPLTVFETDKKIRINVKASTIMDKAGNYIDSATNFEAIVVDFALTSDTYIIDNTNMIIKGLNTLSSTPIATFRNNLSDQTGGTLNVFKRDGFTPLVTGNVGSGVKVSATINGISKTYTVILYGDLDGNGGINATDALIIKRHVTTATQKITVAEYLIAANVQRDAAINATDALVLVRHVTTTQKINQYN
jgi:hypothetical protein